MLIKFHVFLLSFNISWKLLILKKSCRAKPVLQLYFVQDCVFYKRKMYRWHTFSQNNLFGMKKYHNEEFHLNRLIIFVKFCGVLYGTNDTWAIKCQGLQPCPSYVAISDQVPGSIPEWLQMWVMEVRRWLSSVSRMRVDNINQ